MSAVAHLQPHFQKHAEAVHSHPLRDPYSGLRYGYDAKRRECVFCDCGRGTLYLTAKNKGEHCNVCKTRGRLKVFHVFRPEQP